jgi:histidine triad (HIT) family protein
MEQNCIFCQIANGKVPAKKIYEDDRCAAVLDINPASRGHILLLPKKHAAVMPQLPDEDIGHLLMISKALSNAILRSLKVKGTSIFVANGAPAGQRAPHFMMHIIPRTEQDAISLSLSENSISQDDIAKTHEAMLARVKEAFKLDDDTIKALSDTPGSSSKPAKEPPEPSKSGVTEVTNLRKDFKIG